MNQPLNNPFTASPTENPPDLDDLAFKLTGAKSRLAAAQEDVREAERMIVNALGSKEEGSFTARSDHFKVTTTQPISRTVNKSTVEAIRREMPEDIFQAMFEFKPSLNVKLFKECKELRPEIYDLAAKAVTSKPGKVSVKVEVLS